MNKDKSKKMVNDMVHYASDICLSHSLTHFVPRQLVQLHETLQQY